MGDSSEICANTSSAKSRERVVLPNGPSNTVWRRRARAAEGAGQPCLCFATRGRRRLDRQAGRGVGERKDGPLGQRAECQLRRVGSVRPRDVGL